jgi:hypothetical protein
MMANGIGAYAVLGNTVSPKAAEDTLDFVRPGRRVLISVGEIGGGVTAFLDTRRIIAKELEIGKKVLTSQPQAQELYE